MGVKSKGCVTLPASPFPKNQKRTDRNKVGFRKSEKSKSHRGIQSVRQAANSRDGLMTTDEICAFLQVTRSTIYRYLANGMNSLQHGPRGARRYIVGDVLQFLSRPVSADSGTTP